MILSAGSQNGLAILLGYSEKACEQNFSVDASFKTTQI